MVCPNTEGVCKNPSRNFLFELGFFLFDHASSEEIFSSFRQTNFIFCQGLFLAKKGRESFFFRREEITQKMQKLIKLNQNIYIFNKRNKISTVMYVGTIKENFYEIQLL